MSWKPVVHTRDDALRQGRHYLGLTHTYELAKAFWDASTSGDHNSMRKYYAEMFVRSAKFFAMHLDYLTAVPKVPEYIPQIRDVYIAMREASIDVAPKVIMPSQMVAMSGSIPPGNVPWWLVKPVNPTFKPRYQPKPPPKTPTEPEPDEPGWQKDVVDLGEEAKKLLNQQSAFVRDALLVIAVAVGIFLVIVSLPEDVVAGVAAAGAAAVAAVYEAVNAVAASVAVCLVPTYPALVTALSR